VSEILFHVVAFVVAIGVLIVVHEFGHYWVAQTLGVKVLRFSVGFGRPLWSRRVGKDQMEFVVAALPLGGYVKMLDENEGAVPAREKHRAFNRQPIWKRMSIVVAGPLFNFLFAILAYWFVYVAGVDGIKPVIGRVLEGSIAQQAGFRAGDEILAIDGRVVQTWDQRRIYLFQRTLDRARIDIEVRRAGGDIYTRSLDLATIPISEVNASLVERGLGLIGYLPPPLPVIGALEVGPAQRAGLQAGDRITQAAGQAISSWEQLATIINAHPGKPLRLDVARDGATRSVDIIPDAVEQDGRTIGRIHIRPRFGEVPPEMRATLRLGPIEALTEGARSTWSMSWLTLEMLYRMLRLEVSARNISGPITIAQYAGYSARIGYDQFILFLAVISISLGVLNLLPIPVLDGGHLLYYSIEGVKGSPLSERAMAIGQQVGIALLVALMLLAFYNDITRIFH
jgi:regulator of sigma E protease